MEKITIMDVMLYCDGALGPEDMARIATAIAHDPELQAMERDLRAGSTATKTTFAAIGEAPVPPELAAAILKHPHRRRSIDLLDSRLLRYAAAVLIGVLIGGGGMLAGLRSGDSGNLHLAGAPTGDTDPGQSNEFRAALGAALRAGEFNKPLSYRSSEIDGSVALTRGFEIGNHTACAEFTHRFAGAKVSEATRQGIACARPDGGWEIIQLPAGD